MTLTMDMMRKATNVYNAFKETVPFYEWWEEIVEGKSINGFRFCRYCGLPVEHNWSVCIECGA